MKEKYIEQAEIAQYDKKEYQQYEESLKQYRDLKNIIDTAEEEAKEEGRKEGICLGEDKKEKQMLINMHQAGIKLSTISQITGLSLPEIEQLLKS